MLPDIISSKSSRNQKVPKIDSTGNRRGESVSFLVKSNEKRVPSFSRHDQSIQSIRQSKNSSQDSQKKVYHNIILRNAFENIPDPRQYPLRAPGEAPKLTQKQQRVLRNLSKANLPQKSKSKRDRQPLIYVPETESRFQEWYMKHDG